MTLTLRGIKNISIISAYATTALATEHDKDDFYTALSRLHNKLVNKGPLFTLGDFNARVQIQADNDEICIGQHTFDRQNTHLHNQSPEVADNREKFITYLTRTDQVALNTFFYKHPQNLATYKDNKRHPGGPPYTRQHYEVLDYIVAPQRWKNGVTNVYSDALAGINSDHYPLVAHVKVRLKAQAPKPTAKPVNYDACTVEQRNTYNENLNHERRRMLDPQACKAWMLNAAENTIPQRVKSNKQYDISDTSKNLIDQRMRATREGDQIQQQLLTKQIKKSIRSDRRRANLAMVAEDLDPRDRWFGLKCLRKDIDPIPYAMKDKANKRVPMRGRAQAAAEYLAEKIWGEVDTERSSSASVAPPPKIVDAPLNMKQEDFELDELIKAIRRLKRRKSPGPDGTPIELFKELQGPALGDILDLINQWYANKAIPLEVAQARVVLIFKKGDKSDLANYRPISLLNCIYKIYAAMIQKRLADGLEVHMRATQYGFRTKRGTADAIQYVRRLMDKGEMTNTRTLLVLLDWEKAFDKALHV